jgi:hypothetical protein
MIFIISIYLFYVSAAPTLASGSIRQRREIQIMEANGNTQSASGPNARTDGMPSHVMDGPRRAWRAIRAFADWYSEHCRRIRAYMDLTQLDHGTLHAVLSDAEQLDRILEGKPPRRNLQRP